MNRFAVFFAALFLMFLAVASPVFAEAGKYLIILQSGTDGDEGVARAIHALIYTEDLQAHGHEVVLLFDGAGIQWLAETTDGEVNELRPRFDALREAGLTQVICDFCATAFELKENLQKDNMPLVGDYKGHTSIAKYADEGFEIITL